MRRWTWGSRLAGSALFAVALGAAAAGLPGEVGGEVAMGRNLTGDECRLRRVAPGAWGRAAERYQIYCDGWAQPSGALTRLAAGERTVAWWTGDSQWAQGIAESGDCLPARIEARFEGIDAATRRCEHRLGWRRLLLAARSGDSIVVADFLPNNAPLAERALLAALGRVELDAPSPQGRRLASLAAMEELYGKDDHLPSIRELGSYAELQALAWSLQEARQYRKSELAWQRVLEVQERLFGRASPALIVTLHAMAHPVRNQRRYDDAQALIERAAPLVARSGNPLVVAQDAIHRAFDAFSRRNPEAAASFAEKAVGGLSDVAGQRGTLSEAYHVLARARYARDPAAAERAVRQSYRLQYQAQGAHGVWTNRDRILLARTLVAQGKLAEARGLLDDALQSAELMYGRGIWWANAKVVEGELLRAGGKPAAALDAYRAFAAVAQRQEFSCYYGPCLGPYLELLLAPATADAEAAEPALREAFAAVQLAEWPVVSAAISQLAARVGAADGAVAAFAREQQDLDERARRLRSQLQAEMRKPEDQRAAKQEAATAAELRQLTTQLAERELALQDRFPRYAQLVSRTPVDAARAAALLRPEEGLLYLTFVGEAGYAFLLQGGRIRLHAMPLPAATLREQVMALRRGLVMDGRRLPRFDHALAHALYRSLVGPLLDGQGDLRRLIVVPSGPLLSLPPDVLITEATAGTGAPAWLARRFTVAVAPSVRSFVELRTATQPSAATANFLGIGDPRFLAGAAGASRGRPHVVAGADVCAENRDVRAQVAALPALPDSAAEVRAMAKALGGRDGKLLLGEQATKSALRQAALEDRGIIAFATHGLLPNELFCETEPALALAPGAVADADDDGLLRASEIATLRLNASLVILSACNTAGADGQFGGESLSGLVRAFFFAGARSVLATHWPVASAPTVELTTATVRAAAKGLAWPEALRQSKLKMMDAAATAHPFFWGAFSLIGGG